MHPVVLSGTFHEQKTAMPECNLFFQSIYFILFVPEFEVTLRTEADWSNDGVFSQFLFIVTMPGNPVFSIPVVIDQDWIKNYPGYLFDGIFDNFQTGV